MATDIMTIYSLGDDALPSQFEVRFQLPSILGGGAMGNMNFRCTGFKPPERKLTSYPVAYKFNTFSKPAGKSSTTMQTTFNYRLDKQWQLYNYIDSWMKSIGDDTTGIYPSDSINGVSTVRTDFTILCVDGEGNVTKKGWQLIGCWPENQTGVDFKVAGGDAPFDISVTVNFITYKVL